jgi:signal transduction histidine kinase
MDEPENLRWGLPWGPSWTGRRPGWRGGPPPGAWLVLAVVLAFFQVGGSFGASHAQPERTALDPLAVMLLVGGPVCLFLLRRRPQVTVGAVGLVTLVYLARGYPYGPVFVSMAIALVSAVVRGHRMTAWLAAAALLAGDAVSRLVAGTWTPGSQAAVVAWMGVILAVAEVVRVRRERAMTAWQAARETRRRQAGEERLRIAQELHDVVAHHMSLINVQAGVALHLAERKPEQVEPALRAIKDASKEALAELRSLIDVLRDDASPAPRTPAATLAALDDVVERSRHAGLEVTKTVSGQARPLSAAVELAAFRIVQEAITNVVRHAGAKHATIHLGYGSDRLTVQVEDDGHGGSEMPEVRYGNGIRGMHERAQALGGTLRVTASRHGGVRVEATIPTGRQP